MDLSIVIPVRNEAGNIAPLVAEIGAALDGVLAFEVVYVDDGSDDATAAEIGRLQQGLRHLRLVRREGGTVRSVAVNHRPRQRGASKYGVFDRLWVGIVDLFGVLWLRRRSSRPRLLPQPMPLPEVAMEPLRTAAPVPAEPVS